MIRSVLAIVTVVTLTLALGPPATLLSLLDPRRDWVLRLGRLWARGILRVAGVRVSACGADLVPRDRPVLLLSNHLSHSDMLALVLAIPVSFRVVAKRHLFWIPFFGWSLWASGMIPIDRSRKASAIRSLERAAARVRQGTPVLFFPEGTRSADGRLQPFKKGAFVIAVQAGAPILPVAVTGSFEVLPRGTVRMRPGHIMVRFCEQIPVTEYTLETKEALIERVRTALQEGIQQDPRERLSGRGIAPDPSRALAAP